MVVEAGFRREIAQLPAMSDRELRDIGRHHGDIRRAMPRGRPG